MQLKMLANSELIFIAISKPVYIHIVQMNPDMDEQKEF